MEEKIKDQATLSALTKLLEVYKTDKPVRMVNHMNFLIALEVIDLLTKELEELKAKHNESEEM